MNRTYIYTLYVVQMKLVLLLGQRFQYYDVVEVTVCHYVGHPIVYLYRHESGEREMLKLVWGSEPWELFLQVVMIS